MLIQVIDVMVLLIFYFTSRNVLHGRTAVCDILLLTKTTIGWTLNGNNLSTKK